MRPNYKFHAIAIAIICFVIILLYMLIGPKSAPAPSEATLQNIHAIEIYSATWGKECNSYIQEAIDMRKNTPAEKDEKGMLIKPEPLTLVTSNNVLTHIGDLCNGKLTCDIAANSESLGVEPLSSCAKKLDIAYRCYSYDRLWNISIGQGKTTTINCDAAAKPATK